MKTRKWDYTLSIAEALVLGYRLGSEKKKRKQKSSKRYIPEMDPLAGTRMVR